MDKARLTMSEDPKIYEAKIRKNFVATVMTYLSDDNTVQAAH